MKPVNGEIALKFQPRHSQTEVFKTFRAKSCCMLKRSGVFSGLKHLLDHMPGRRALKACGLIPQ
jgi:hypothetical protein